MYARFVATLVPAWIPARLFWAYFTGIAFVAAAVSIATKRMLGMAAMLLGTMFFLWVVFLHAPRVTGAIRNGNEVTSLFVAVAMCGLSFVLAGTYGRSLEERGAFIE
jgi:positive regulator of sigma E activity